MRNFILAIAALFAAITVQASSVKVTWDPNPPAENVTGYKVYWNTVSQSYSGVTPDTIGNRTEHVVINLQPGTTYYFVVTAYNSAGESGFSQEASVTTSEVPGAVLNLRIVGESPDPQ